MISRRKTIGTICDAIQTKGEASEKAIRSLIGDAKRGDNLASFAKKAKQAAKTVPVSRRFGDTLVYIADAWDNMKDSYSLVLFKAKLLKAYDRDLIELAKPDMPQALPQDRLRRSIIKGRAIDLAFIRV